MSDYQPPMIQVDSPLDDEDLPLISRAEIRWIIADIIADRRSDEASVLKCERHLCGYIRSRDRERRKRMDNVGNPVSEQAP